jgi:3-isopropylmalate/(R)-2-methylmalate dehydratase small subunit
MEMDQLPAGKITIVKGRGMPLKGDNIDTDHIYPARFLKELTYDKAVQNVFYDERFTSDGKLKEHPFNDKRYEGARILVVNSNFGCGSGRDQGQHAFIRLGFRAIIGESFAELFINGCLARGLPAVSVSHSDVEAIMCSIEENPMAELTVDLVRNVVSCGSEEYALTMPAAYHNLLLNGTWDVSSSLLSRIPEIRAMAKKLPYLNGFHQ